MDLSVTQPHTRRHQADGRGGAASGMGMGDTERLASLLGGAALAALGLRQGGLGGLALAAGGGYLVYRGATGQCPVCQALGVGTNDEGTGPRTSVPATHGVKTEHRVTVARPVGEVFRFWRNFENLPRVMPHLREVRVTGNRSHWVADAPLGTSVEWDAEVINERENELIAWRSLEGSQVDTAGSVHFRPAGGGNGTEVHVSLKYDPPAGKIGATVARLFGQTPEQQIPEDLQRFKQLMEGGAALAGAGRS